jgi:hypothetical protein
LNGLFGLIEDCCEFSVDEADHTFAVIVEDDISMKVGLLAIYSLIATVVHDSLPHDKPSYNASDIKS